MPSTPLLEATVEALIGRILNVPAYTADELGAHAFRGDSGDSVTVILVKAKHRNLIAAALRAYVEKWEDGIPD